MGFVKGIPILGQYFECKRQHYSASLLEFGFILLASLLPIFVVSIIEIGTGLLKDFSNWNARFSPELSIAASCIIAPMMYFFVTPANRRRDGERTDFPHKGSLQLACLAVFSLGMILYVLLSSIKFFSTEYAEALSGTISQFGIWLYIPALFLSYTAILFRNFSEQPPLEGPDADVDSVLDDLEKGD